MHGRNVYFCREINRMKTLTTLLVILGTVHSMQVFCQVTDKEKAGKPVALTFDACMTTGMAKRVAQCAEGPLYNREVIGILAREKVPATLFLSGLWAEKYPDAVREMAQNPLFEIGNHSWSHRSFGGDCFGLPVLPEEEKEADIRKTQEILFRLTGRKPALFRFPGGCYNKQDLDLLARQDLRMTAWTFASGDAFSRDTSAIVQQVLSRVKSGAIVVFHLDGGKYAPVTAEVIRQIIPELRRRGYRFTTVSGLGNRTSP